MGFLDKLLGRKPAEAPQTTPEPAAMPAADAGEHDHSHEGHDHDHDHEGHDHEH
jgi:hypothetical protein